ncbi:MAG TPA: FAD-dependent oxidoreductase [Rhodothermales bacterium]|nr:FAD-dependent oxidoreductase [Rhodothermales bacterium]
MERKRSEKPHVVVVGGGFGGLEAALSLRRQLGDQVRLTLVSDKDDFLFRPHLIYVPFGFEPEQAKIDLVEIAAAKNLRFVRAHVHAIDPAKKTLELDSGPLPYDYLILATGASIAPSGVPGLEEQAYAVWRESDLALLRLAFDRLLRKAEQGQQQQVVFLVPPTSQWAGPLYELAFMLAQWLDWKEVREAVSIRFLTHEQTYMGALGPQLHEALVEEFEQHGIDAQVDQVVKRLDGKELVIESDERIASDLLIVSPTYQAAVTWEALPTDADGFLRTELKTRQVIGHDAIYAVGDGSDYPVKQAFLALLQADAAVEHLAAWLLGTQPDFVFEPSSLWMMEQFGQALFAQVPLGSDEEAEQESHIESVPPGLHQRVALRAHLPWQARTNNPLYAGLLWKGTRTGRNLLLYLMKREEQ